MFQFSYFNPEKKAFQKRHIDSSAEKKYDTGRKFTCLYFVNDDVIQNFSEININKSN